MLGPGIMRDVRYGVVVLLLAVTAAGCGGGGGDAGGPGATATGPRSENPRVNAVLGCLEGNTEAGSAYALDVDAVSLNTEENAVEIYFDKTEAQAQKRKREIESVGIGVVYVTGTVVESWITPPTAPERAPVTECVAKDPGP